MVSGGKGTAKGAEGSDCYYCSAAVEPLLTERKDSFDAVGEALLTERKDSFDAAGEALLTGQKNEGFLLISCDNEKKKLLLQSV
jgi:hypothetical protein